MTLRIPLAKPQITDSDREAVAEVLRTPHLSMGPKLAEFEQAICDYTGSKYAVAVNSGTSALQIAVRALNIDPGSEVVVPSFSFSALLNVVLLEKLRPRFVEIDPETYNLKAHGIATALTEQTRLIIAVHTFGFPLDLGEIGDAVRSYLSRARRPRQTVHVVEDACEALGTETNGGKAGTFGDAGLFAFYPNKQVTTGEGGVLVTSVRELASRARILRNQGRDPVLDWYQQAETGFSYRLSDLNCALGISQLQRLEATIARRQYLAEIYDRELARIAEIIRPSVTSPVGRISWFVYPIQLTAQFTRVHRDRICESLARKGIASGRYFSPLHLQPILGSYGIARPALPQTEFVADRVMTLPFFNELTQGEIQEVSGAVEESMRELRLKT